jgi:phosphohistidine phosphatase SixA
MRWFHSVCTFSCLAIAPLIFGGCQGSVLPAPQFSTTPKIIVSPQTPSVNPSPSQTQKPTPTTVSKVDIWSRLRQGKGYVILFRHALAPGTGDPPNFRLDDCSTQRNLSAAGRKQAVRMGEALRQQNISVSKVFSSQWCRCLETAKLMNVGQVEPFPVINSFFQDSRTERSQTEQLRQFILKNRDTPGVIVMVTHQVNITAISDIFPQSGAAVVMRASTPNQIELVGELK